LTDKAPKKRRRAIDQRSSKGAKAVRLDAVSPARIPFIESGIPGRCKDAAMQRLLLQEH